jgi:uncharacterized protein (TIGR02145 family)
LINYLGGSSVACGKLKEIGISHWTSPNADATDVVGFTALPGGFNNPNSGFSSIGNYGYWWSSTLSGSTSVRYRSLGYSGALYGENDGGGTVKNKGYSIRCIKD